MFVVHGNINKKQWQPKELSWRVAKDTCHRVNSKTLTSGCKMALAQMIGSFAKGSHTYDREAYVQGIAARSLGACLPGLRLPEGPILEIGCGTGFLTKEIALHFPDRSALITDICPAMIEKCRFNVAGNLSFSVLDGENFVEKNKYALIASGLAFQWFTHFEKSIANLYEGLKPGGLLLFSFLEAKSFPEWKKVCAELELPYTGNDLPRIDCLSNFVSWEQQIALHYPSALECLKAFKRIGANTPLHGKRLSLTQMRTLLNRWDQEAVSLTYNIAYGAIYK